MNPKEAKDALDYFKRRKEMYLDDLIQKRENAAIHALEKQIPKKPIESEFTPLICPDCEAKVTLGQRYCENCGQKINWEVQDD